MTHPAAILQQAIEHVRGERFDEALRLFEPCVADPATRAEALGHRAWLHRSLGSPAEAIADYEALLALNPADDLARTLLADCFRMQGEPLAGLGAALDILRRNPLFRPAAHVVIQCQEALGVFEPPEFTYRQNEPWHPVNPVIAVLEDDQRSYPTSVFPPVGRFLYSLVRCVRPKLILETGCYIGYSTLCMAQAMQENGGGHSHSFDLFTPRPDLVSPFIGPCPDGLRVARAHADRAGLAHRITFHKGDSAQRIRDIFGGHKAGFDLAFIDGDHTIQGCLADWRQVDRLLRHGGLVLLHDTEPHRCGWMGPRHLIETLRAEVPTEYQAVTIPSPEGFGIALVQKLGDREGPDLDPPLGRILREWLFLRKFFPSSTGTLMELLRTRR